MIVQNVSKKLGGKTVLNGVDLELAPGEISVLIGPSGCGKSTLLKIMVGLVWPDHGNVFLDGQTLDEGHIWKVRRRFGYVIQEGGLFPHLTAAENIQLMADYLKWPESKIQSRTRELVELTQFPSDALARYPAQLSGGQRQRVSLMRALFLNPDYLFLDEPLGALDPMIRADLQRDLLAIFRQLDKTVLLVTHDLYEAVFFADVIVLMNQGRFEQRSSAEELLKNPKSQFARRFVGAQRHDLSRAETKQSNDRNRQS